MNSAEFLNHFDKEIKESFDLEANIVISDSYFAQLADVENTDEYAEFFTGDEGSEGAGWLNESEDHEEVTTSEGFKVGFESAEFGNKLSISRKLRLKVKDSTTKMADAVSRRKAKLLQNLYFFLELQIIPTLTGGLTTVLAPDGLPVFSAAHIWKTPGAPTWGNIITAGLTPLAFMKALEAHSSNMVDAHGKPFMQEFNTFVVKKAGNSYFRLKELFYDGVQPTTLGNVNLYQGRDVTIIGLPAAYMSDGDRIFVRASGAEDNSLFVSFVQRPTLEDMIVRENGDWVYPAAGSVKYGWRNQPIDWVTTASLTTHA